MQTYVIDAARGGNIPFLPNTSMAVVGSTGSGKTWFVHRFLRHLDAMFGEVKTDKILYCYSVYQELFNKMKETIPRISFHQGLPDREEIEQLAGSHALLVLDDLMSEVTGSRTMQDLFCQYCHHKAISVLYLTQNLFQSGKCARTIALNTQVIILMRNMRNASQIRYLASQIYPGRVAMLQEIYEDAIRLPYGYLVIDMAPGSEDLLRLRTEIFPGERGVVYVPKER